MPKELTRLRKELIRWRSRSAKGSGRGKGVRQVAYRLAEADEKSDAGSCDGLCDGMNKSRLATTRSECKAMAVGSTPTGGGIGLGVGVSRRRWCGSRRRTRPRSKRVGRNNVNRRLRIGIVHLRTAREAVVEKPGDRRIAAPGEREEQNRPNATHEPHIPKCGASQAQFQSREAPPVCRQRWKQDRVSGRHCTATARGCAYDFTRCAVNFSITDSTTRINCTRRSDVVIGFHALSSRSIRPLVPTQAANDFNRAASSPSKPVTFAPSESFSACSTASMRNFSTSEAVRAEPPCPCRHLRETSPMFPRGSGSRPRRS